MIIARAREKLAKSNQEQAVAAWVNYLNQMRLDSLMQALRIQDSNLELAMQRIDDTFRIIREDVIIKNRGGIKGMHGFIAEVAECGVGNARREILGKAPNYTWINDNGPADMLRDGVAIQQKFVNAGNHLSLQAIKHHLDSYPWFLENGGKYQIPEDHYEKIKKLLAVSKEQAYKMPTDTGEFSLKQWKEVHEFFKTGDIKLSDIEPSKLSYKAVQAERVQEALKFEKKNLRRTDRELRRQAYQNSNPTLQEGALAGVTGAAVEGGFTFCAAIIRKIRSGKSISAFTAEDWKDICTESGVSSFRGGVRGVTIYSLSNYTATPAAVASALVTAAFGIAQQAYLFRKGHLSSEEFLLNSEVLCVDVSVSALSSFVGQMVIPIPVLGAVIGNTVGSLVYQIAKDNLKRKERNILTAYLRELEELEKNLDKQYRAYVQKLNDEMNQYYALLESAFAMDCRDALEGSIKLALYVGVPADQVLKNRQEIDAYFLS